MTTKPDLMAMLIEIRDQLHTHPDFANGASKVHYAAHKTQAAMTLASNLLEQNNLLLSFCHRSFRALDEDYFPQLRDDLREALDKWGDA
ncbi:hypothetical protein UFOVP393_55 [uncultured Caudovirales phage]|uniref:Uncharacterized protein n=1 Tax=uncultured Caudovirales phage TaxID=2100421 RepID=A0A6J7X5E0_9CAUD|nr:hypothetical protein UFOVP393_55 [uncultured Caudovirales phage]